MRVDRTICVSGKGVGEWIGEKLRAERGGGICLDGDEDGNIGGHSKKRWLRRLFLFR